jgi:ribosomal protein L7/L12
MPSTEFWMILAVFGMTMCVLIVQGRAQDRLARLERKLDALLKHQGIDLNSQMPSEITELLRQGKKIAAIKLYRETTGVGLAQAKDQVEAIERGESPALPG